MPTKIHGKKPPPQLKTVLFWNCARGIFDKKVIVEKYIKLYKPCVFFISECDLSKGHMTEMLSVEDYRIEIAETLESKNKGRLLAYVRNKDNLKRMRKLEEKDNDLIVLGDANEMVLVGVYAGFKTTEGETIGSNFERLVTNLKNICSKCQTKVIVGGDFNADPRTNTPKAKLLEILQADYGLDQLVETVTRERLVLDQLQQSMIDLVYARDVPSARVAVVHSEASDHHLVTLMYETKSTQPIYFKKRVVIDWRRNDAQKMSAFAAIALENSRVMTSEDPNVVNRDLTAAISESMNQTIPKRVIHTRRDTDVVSYELEALKKKRDRHLKLSRKTGDPKERKKVRELDKAVVKMIKKERARIIKSKLKDSSPQNFWVTVGGLLGRGPGTKQCDMYDGDKLLTDDQAAEAFARFFKQKVDNLVLKNPVSFEMPPIPGATASPFTVDEISKAIASFHPKKSMGPDEVPMLVLKQCFDVLCPSIKRLFDLIVQRNKIPDVWRIARIKPIFKKGDASCTDNYRPISNLNAISKIFERCILNRIPDVDGVNQHGFKNGHSTSTAAVELQDALCNELDKNKICLVYSVDLSAAFDLIRPGLFVKKAAKLIEPGLVHLMKEFIINRRAYVEFNGTTSCTFSMDVGTPQGSTLGPKVFNIYCHDLIDAIEDGFLVTFADDSYVLVSADNIDELKDKATKTLKSHIDWLNANGMVTNLDKTEVMLLNSDESFSLCVDGQIIEPRQTMRVLGILFDNKMSWKPHVDAVLTRTNRIFHGLRTIRKHLNAEQANQVITAYYFSVLYYGSECWLHQNLGFHLKRRIHSAHYRALRLVFGEDSRQNLDKKCKRASPDEWSNYCLAKMTAMMMIKGYPSRLLQTVATNSYVEGRQRGRMFFFDSSKRKIGRQCIRNRLQFVTRQMRFEWLNTPLTQLRPRLKECFFDYAKTT